jgi:hypothetical protein
LLVFLSLPLSLQEKLRSLKRYVYELKESYDELLRAFSELKLTSKDQVIELERVLANKMASIKVYI